MDPCTAVVIVVCVALFVQGVVYIAAILTGRDIPKDPE